jgi:hypothetical protein
LSPLLELTGTLSWGRVGQAREKILDLLFELGELAIERFDRIGDLPHLRDEGLGFALLLLALELRNSFGRLVALRLELLHLGDEPSALLVELEQRAQRYRLISGAQASLDFLRVLADQFDVQHRAISLVYCSQKRAPRLVSGRGAWGRSEATVARPLRFD